jgi:hypothetical protein
MSGMAGLLGAAADYVGGVGLSKRANGPKSSEAADARRGRSHLTVARQILFLLHQQQISSKISRLG